MPETPELIRARAALEYARTSPAIHALVESAPPFTAEQRIKIRAILTNPAGPDA